MRIICSACGNPGEGLIPSVYKRRKSLGLPIDCPWCKADLCKTGTVAKTGRSENQRRSRVQEKKAAARYGGRVQPASGAMADEKGDIRDHGRIRGECKFTRAKSFSLKLEELKKIESEAVGGELPLFEIEFQRDHPYRRYVVVPDWVMEKLLGDHDEANQDA